MCSTRNINYLLYGGAFKDNGSANVEGDGETAK